MSAHRAPKGRRARPAAAPAAVRAGGATATLERPVADPWRPPEADTVLLPRVAPQPYAAPAGVAPGQQGRGSRRDRRAQRRVAARRRNRRLLAGGLVLALVAGVGAATLLHRGGSAPTAPTAVAHRTQGTLLLVLTSSDGHAVESALLAHDPRTREGAVVLVPSQTVTDVAGHGQLPFGTTPALGAPQLAAETLGDLLGVTVDGTLRLPVPALSTLVDRVGGVHVDSVDADVVVPGPGDNERVLVAKGGAQVLGGAAAVAYATYRAPGEGEEARLARFTAVLGGLIDALPGAAGPAGALVTGVAGAGAATESPSGVGTLLTGLRADDSAGNLAYETLPVQQAGTGEDQFTVDTDQVEQLTKRYRADSIPAGRVAGDNRVIVLNGTGALNLGESAHEKLDRHNLVFVHSGNQQGFSFRHRPSVVLVPDDSAASRALGHRVATALGLPDTAIRVTDQPTSAADAVVILGADYHP
jgi:anionic cell wall polymer biosynthesis LytR-Cps2A-Psr (LCP) family protein